jgi:hypothetical protein
VAADGRWSKWRRLRQVYQGMQSPSLSASVLFEGWVQGRCCGLVRRLRGESFFTASSGARDARLEAFPRGQGMRFSVRSRILEDGCSLIIIIVYSHPQRAVVFRIARDPQSRWCCCGYLWDVEGSLLQGKVRSGKVR